MPASHLAAFVIAATLIAGYGESATPRPGFAVPAGSLAEALALLARQGGVDIGGIDPALSRIASPGLSGSMAIERALGRLLAHTPFEARQVAPGTYRLVRRAPPVAVRPPPPQRTPLAPRPVDVGLGEIVVTGGKRDVPLALYPGSATVIVLGGDGFGPHGGDGQDYLLRQTPILQSTELGAGRNKLFIRGIADSSFTGPTQATAGTYFGDVRTGYNGPDPNLNLYDVERVEVLEGPQGTLYGAGSIGGIIRLSPRPPALDGAEASIDTGASVTAHGAPGYDVAGMVNYAPWEDRVAIRLVGYRNVAGGYIDDPGRGVSNINRTAETGGRASIRIRPIDGLTIDAGAVIQNSRQPDLQYALVEDAPLTRLSAIAQPFEDDYTLERLVIAKDWDSGLRLFSATGHVAHDTDQRYDVTRPGGFANPVAYDEQNTIRLITEELRLSRTLPDGRGWLIGAAYVHDTTGKAREFGLLDSQRDLVGVTNRTEEKSVFATTTQTLFRVLSVTAGARYTHARMDGDPSTTTRNTFIRGQSSSRVDPELAVSARLLPRLVLFSQYQQGFRTGGLAVAAGVGRVASFEDDKIRVGEVGLRLLRQGTTGLAAVAALSYARWDHIQADLVSRNGFPYTANVGNGRIVSFEGSADWVPVAGLKLSGGLFLNHSRLIDPAPDFVSSGSRPLPDTPSLAATSAVAWTRPIGRAQLQLAANARYIGRSRLGVGPALDLPYGNYLETGMSATLKLTYVSFTLSADNLLDTVGNRFAIGNPFGVAYRDEVTPLRPRTLRLGARANF